MLSQESLPSHSPSQGVQALCAHPVGAELPQSPQEGRPGNEDTVDKPDAKEAHTGGRSLTEASDSKEHASNHSLAPSTSPALEDPPSTDGSTDVEDEARLQSSSKSLYSRLLKPRRPGVQKKEGRRSTKRKLTSSSAPGSQSQISERKQRLLAHYFQSCSTDQNPGESSESGQR